MSAVATTAQLGRKANAVRKGHHHFKGLKDDLAPSKVFVADLSAIEDSKHKLYAHVAYLRLIVTMVFTTVDASMTAAVGGFTLQSFISNMKFKVAGSTHWEGLNGMLVTSALINGRFPYAIGRQIEKLPAQLTKADATGLSRTVELFIPLFNKNAPEGMQMDRVIPVGVFNRGAKGTCEFSCQVVPTQAELAPGVTCTAVTEASLDVGIVYLDYVNEPTEWSVNVSRDSKKVKTLESRGAWESLLIWNSRGPAVASSHATYDIKQVTLGSTPLLEQSHTGADLLDAEGCWHFDDQDPYAGNTWRSGCPFVPIFTADPAELRVSKMAAGPLRIDITTRPAQYDDDTLVYVDTGIRTPEYSRKFREELGCPVEGGGLVEEVGAANGGGGAIAPFLPARLYWPGCPAELVASKAGAKLAENAAAG